ncbi:MAG TPA: M48 family metalloprotease [Nocardioides sp.]|nr:M48 family metalloprotease [Nocardioides sp.]
MDAGRAGPRAVATGTLLAGVVAFVVVAVLLVPWQAVPHPVAASSIFSADEIARAEHFSRWARVWSWSALAVSLAVACGLGFSRLGPALMDRLPGPRWLRVVLGVAVLTLVGELVTLPLGIAARELRLRAGLAAGSWAAWGVDLAKSALVTVVATSVVVLAVMGCARRWPRAWPAVAGVGLSALVVVGSFVYPVLVEPLFNSFEPLPDGSLRTAVFELADQEGVHIDDVLVADASRRTTTLNAYVSGFGRTRRVVLYDTLVDGTPQPEAMSVVAHELAHAKHGDVVTGTALGAAGALVGVGLLGLLLSGVGETRVVPRLLAVAAIATLASSPVQNEVSRQLELRADQTALRVTHDPATFMELQRRLALRSRADPTPPDWSQWWFGSHPTVLERIALTRAR